MDSKKSLYTAGTVFLGLLSLALIASYFLPKDKIMLDMQTTNRPESRTITVSGEGSVVAKPDVAKISVSVVSEGKTIDKVIIDNTNKMNAIIKKLKEIGMSADDITTSGYFLSPQYNYPEREMPTISGYRLEQTLALIIRNLELVDDVIDATTNLGANNIYGLTFTLDDDTDVMNQAREEAFAVAKEKAKQMANAAGVRLGAVYSFNEGYYGGQPVPMYADSVSYVKTSEGRGAPDIQSGTQEYNVTVNITYEIE